MVIESPFERFKQSWHFLFNSGVSHFLRAGCHSCALYQFAVDKCVPSCHDERRL